MLLKRKTLILLLLVLPCAYGLDLKDCSTSFDASAQSDSIIEHIYGGAPDNSELFERRAFVFAYDVNNLVPKWSAWQAIKAYRDTPKRKSIWDSFRTDPELDAVKDSDYHGWFDTDNNYARGHIVPYFISGGDRDHDGIDAENEGDLRVEDPDDACTVFEINAMSNIAPQYHNKFNGQPGVWWLLEADERQMVDDGREFNIFAGTIFLPGIPIERIGDRRKAPSTWKIGVPHGFFKLIIDTQRQEAIAFLFDHAGDLDKGCNITDTTRLPSECIVLIEDLEKVSGLKFFTTLNHDKNARLRNSSNKTNWFDWIN